MTPIEFFRLNPAGPRDCMDPAQRGVVLVAWDRPQEQGASFAVAAQALSFAWSKPWNQP